MFLIILAASLLQGCLTMVEDQGAYREQHKHILGGGMAEHGSSLSYLRHGGSNLGFGLALEKGYVRKIRLNHEESFASINEGEVLAVDERLFYEDYYSAGISTMYFPFQKSGFFVGGAILFKRYQTAYDEHTLSFGINDSNEVTSVEWIDDSIEGAFPVGFSWNFEERVTMLGAIAPAVNLSNKRYFLDDGGTSSVDRSKRSLSLSALDRDRETRLQYMSMIGWRL